MNNLPDLNLNHLINLTDSTGVMQHARYHLPDRNHGYCLDDNVRALLVISQMKDKKTWDTKLENLLETYLSFVDHAYNLETKKYRNFMSYSRQWLEDEGSDDSQGRTMWAICSLYVDEKFQFYHLYLEKLLDQCIKIKSKNPLSIAYRMLGLAKLASANKAINYSLEEIIESDTAKLLQFFKQNPITDWPWFSEAVTYDSARIPQAMIEVGYAMAWPSLIKYGLKLLDWLIYNQFSDGIFHPIGNEKWFTPKGKSRYDQQPLEAAAMLDACFQAGLLTQNPNYFRNAHQAFMWYLGENSKNVCLYDPLTGGCKDGIGFYGANLNQGAESTLAWLSSLLTMKIYQMIEIYENS